MNTKLLRFKVRQFRSIEESEWIEVGENSCLVGTNEAGKTNLLIALWKLNPANKEEIRPLADFPRNLYSQYKTGGHSNDVFIEGIFELDDVTQKIISEKLSCDIGLAKFVHVCRKYNGEYEIFIPYTKIQVLPVARIVGLLSDFKLKLIENEAYIKEPDLLKNSVLDAIDTNKFSSREEDFSKEDIHTIHAELLAFSETAFGRKQILPEFFEQNLLVPLVKLLDGFDGKPLETTSEVKSIILESLPKFIYYSDYGNLDSEIYLPRVIEDIERKDLTESARAKARTLDVLFKYVGLSPQEIYDLGNDRRVVVKTVNEEEEVIDEVEQDITQEQINEWAEKKKERAVLLKSASSDLTKNFKQWWLQGNYIFSFEADGNHFRINVSDELRPESIELEGRSRGLQWFFSFFLVFLVETKQGHANSILLLDEPGLSLHPLAQYDLSNFFQNLSENNQLIYTSHSPFLVNMDNLANVKAVYVDQTTGRTNVSSDLRYNQNDSEKSIYPVHAALGLTVSDTLLLGCESILVEGVSDQIYLNAIKRHLISKGKFLYNKELVFIPVGGVKGMSPITKLVSSRDNELPFVLLDSDKRGKEYLKQILNGRYKDQKGKALEVQTFIGIEGMWEIEDLLPSKALIDLIDRVFRGKQYFSDVYKMGEPIVDQIENWAKSNNMDLPEGWKVDLAKEVVKRFDRMFNDVPVELEEKWVTLFSTFGTKTEEKG